MVEFLSGALVMAYFISGVYFLRFWRRTRDRLFMHFAVAFWLFAVTQIIVTALGSEDQRSGHPYVLRIAGFIFILAAIVDKNLFSWIRRK